MDDGVIDGLGGAEEGGGHRVVDLSVVHGRVLVRDGRLTTVDVGPLVERHNRLAREMVDGKS